MHTPSDADKWFSFLPPVNTLEAQLIKRGDPPEIVHDDVVIEYEPEPGAAHPASHSDFWNNVQSLFGRSIPPDTGLFGKGMRGTLDFDSTRNSFLAPGVPVLPGREHGIDNPYPRFTIKAKRVSTGAVLMSTTMVAPVSTEIGCRYCHGGGWKNGQSGISDTTARNILRAHDRINGTTLLNQALAGKPQLCQSCHPDPALGTLGEPGVTDFSSAMHGWHALYMPTDDSRGCAMCHPSSTTGSTRFLRDGHAALDLGCVDCHGTMAGTAVSLLKSQEKVPAVTRLMDKLQPPNKDSIHAREAWLGEPDCLTCHKNFQPPQVADAFNSWTTGMKDLYRVRADVVGVRCPACHGSPHATYPTHNPMGRDRDNLQPLQYTGMRGPIGSNGQCAVCHRKPMKNSIHHENMEHPFRNVQLPRFRHFRRRIAPEAL